MSFNGAGTFQINSSGQPVVTNTTISSTVFNALTADLATGLSTCITLDGQSTTTQLIPFAAGIKTDILSPVTALGPVSLTAGQIKFPATQNPSSNVNTLDDYEEGTWTPVDSSGAALVLNVIYAEYTKIGRQVTLVARLFYPVTVDGSNALLGGLPFTVATNCYAVGAINTDNALNFIIRSESASTTAVFRGTSNNNLTNSQLTGALVGFTLTYFV